VLRPRRASSSPEKLRNQKIEEYRVKFEHPYQPAERGYVDDVIMPHDTRKCVCHALELLENKQVARPWRKYSNINL
jgi:acetyl-CoA carboxylase carboxyltransferase component